MLLIRMDVIYKNCQKEWQLEVMKDGPPVDQLRERRNLKQISDDEKLMYVRTKMPVMSDRDYIMHFKREYNDDGSVLTTMQSVETEDIPVPANVVRCDMFKS